MCEIALRSREIAISVLDTCFEWLSMESEVCRCPQRPGSSIIDEMIENGDVRAQLGGRRRSSARCSSQALCRGMPRLINTGDFAVYCVLYSICIYYVLYLYYVVIFPGDWSVISEHCRSPPFCRLGSIPPVGYISTLHSARSATLLMCTGSELLPPAISCNLHARDHIEIRGGYARLQPRVRTLEKSGGAWRVENAVIYSGRACPDSTNWPRMVPFGV